MEVFTYRKLLVYQRSKDFVKQVYCMLKLFPKEEQYALCDQLRRASISIASNLAEGMGRCSLKEQAHFIEIAYGSLNEVMCQLELAADLGYITIKDLKNIEVQYEEIAKMLSGLRKSKLREERGERREERGERREERGEIWNTDKGLLTIDC